MNDTSFAWPAGHRAACSITFDDGRASQVVNGLPILDRFGIKATFYPMPEALDADPVRWKAALLSGHEIGNHSLCHPCSCNFPFSRAHALEDYTIARMGEELDAASARIEAAVGVHPATFAYPCGEQFVGRGAGIASYVPVVAERFLVGRGFGEWGLNDPMRCDLAKIYGRDSDRASLLELKSQIDEACRLGAWLIIVAHEVADQGSQSIAPAVLAGFCEQLAFPGCGVWVDTVENIGRHVRGNRIDER